MCGTRKLPDRTIRTASTSAFSDKTYMWLAESYEFAADFERLTIKTRPGISDRFQNGQFDGAIYGHGGSVSEPYEAMRLYQSVSIAVPGAHQANFTRWKNADYDKLVDEAYSVTPTDKERLIDLWRRAMEIWLPQLPDIQLVQNYQRLPWNTTYWKNWPTKQNLYVNGAHFHLTFAMVLWNLQRA